LWENSKNPGLGKKYERISKEISGLGVERHIIFYHEIKRGEIEIIRILHERMDLKSTLEE
jgi:toxin ParE1/3/4